jgi:hypothetical protein
MSFEALKVMLGAPPPSKDTPVLVAERDEAVDPTPRRTVGSIPATGAIDPTADLAGPRIKIPIVRKQRHDISEAKKAYAIEYANGLDGAEAARTPSGDPLRFHIPKGTYTPVCVLHGPGGTGQTYRVRQYAEEHDDETVLMTATTGVAAINIGPGCVTVNSAFKFFDEESLRDGINRRWESIAKEIRNNDMVVIDEVSMLSSNLLDLLYGFIEKLNSSSSMASGPTERPIKLLLSGDFCQLPPVARDSGTKSKRNAETPFAFKAQCWPAIFEPAITKLTQNYRQANDPAFQQALYYARIGNGPAAAAALDGKITYRTTVDIDFPGLTLYSVNKHVDAHNERKLKDIKSPVITDRADSWGTPHGDWKEVLLTGFEVKIGAQVRITANNFGFGYNGVEYVNGDIGELLEYIPGKSAKVYIPPSSDGKRPERNATVVPVTRYNARVLYHNEEVPKICNGVPVPKAWTGSDRFAYDEYMTKMFLGRNAFYDPKARKMVIGAMKYLPISLGWASTIHKCQGLTVDAIQIDISNPFAASPQMMYVALSRCRTAAGIHITGGDASKLVTRIRAHPDVVKYV